MSNYETIEAGLILGKKTTWIPLIHRKVLFISCLALFISSLYSDWALAERADRNKPVHLESDSATVEDYKRKEAFRVSTFTGNVVLTQGTIMIKADKIIMKEDLKGYRYATAHGNLVSFRQKREGANEFIEAWSQRVEYNDQTDKIELFGKARLKRGPDEVKGDYISYDIVRDFFQVKGNSTKAEVENPDRRVRVVIQPKAKSPPVENDSENATPQPSPVDH